MAERHKLTNEEFNLVSRWTGATKFDSVMDIQTGDAENDYFMDYENDMELSLEEGFAEMAEAVAYPFSHEGFSDDEAKVLIGLLEEFGVDKCELERIRNLKED